MDDNRDVLVPPGESRSESQVQNAPSSNPLPSYRPTWGEHIESINMSQPQNTVAAPTDGGTVVIVSVNRNDGDTSTTNAQRDDFIHNHPSHPSSIQDSETLSRTARADHEIYSDQLLTKKRGYPLWVPGPGMQLPIEYRRQGTSIGDVGIVTSNGSFDFLFNIFHPANHPINRGLVPPGFLPLSLEDLEYDIQKTMDYGPDSYLASSSVRKTSSNWFGQALFHPSGTTIGQRFESTATEAAILIMPDGAKTQNLLNTWQVRQTIIRDAKVWYQYAKYTRGRDVRDGDIRVVIGFDKVNSWGIATSTCNTGQTASFMLKHDSTHVYRWDCIGGSGRVGPRKDEIDDLRVAENDVIPQNQSVFVRTLNFTVSGKIWDDLQLESVLRLESGSRPGHRNSASDNRGGQREGPGGSGSGSTSSYHPSGSIPGSFHSVKLDPVEVGVNHPSTAIHKCLHEKFPDASIVITDDLDWISILNDDYVVFPEPEDLCKRILKAYELENHHGIIQLVRKDDPNTGPSVPPTHLDDGLVPSRPPSEAGSSHSQPSKMVLRYNDGRPDSFIRHPVAEFGLSSNAEDIGNDLLTKHGKKKATIRRPISGTIRLSAPLEPKRSFEGCNAVGDKPLLVEHAATHLNVRPDATASPHRNGQVSPALAMRFLSPRPAYNGYRRKLILAFDVGTITSGISYSILDPGQCPSIYAVTRFPAQEIIAGTSKVPSVIYYDRNGRVKAIGAEAMKGEIPLTAMEGGWYKAEWFKLHLRSKYPGDKHDQSIPPLPPNKTIVEVLADYLRYLLDCSASYIKDSHSDGHTLWSSVKDDIYFVLSHPNGLEGKEQSQMRKAAVKAGLVPDDLSGHSRISFVTEGEASLHFAIENCALPQVIEGQGIVIIDAGGGTINVSTYKHVSDSGLSIFEEISVAQCYFQGGVFVTLRAGDFLKDLLFDSPYLDDIDNISECFDKTTKARFRNSSVDQYIRFGSARDNDDSYGIRFGQLKIAGSSVAKFFQPSIDCVVQAVMEQKRSARNGISHVVLVGGFAASDYLFERVKTELTRKGLTFIRPDNRVNKAVSDGAISFFLDHRVGTRVAKVSYGAYVNVPFNKLDPEHVKRSALMFKHVDGLPWIGGVFDLVLPKNTQVPETKEFVRSFNTPIADPGLSRIRTGIMCYRGSQKDPKWIDTEPANFTTVCELEADLSQLPKIANWDTSGNRYYTVKYGLVLKFGLTELQAQLRWLEDGVERRSPASLIYDGI